ncbi:MAG: alpha/beta fold hydrolase [Longimicrobiales bacterium]
MTNATVRAMLYAATLSLLAGCRPGPANPAPASDRRVISFAELLEEPLPPAGVHISYGTGPLQFGELRLPKGRGPFPVAVVIHGGCWLKQYNLRHAAREAATLTASGIATWTIEYRGADDEGGGWPGTFEDVAHATDHVTRLANHYRLDLKRVVLVGHSAGGQLALWLASRTQHSAAAPNPSLTPLSVRGVVSLAGITDLRTFGARSGGCSGAVATLLGGNAAEQSARYDAVSPVALLPLGIPVRLVHGDADTSVPFEQSEDYVARAQAAGDDASARILAGAGHFDLIAPVSAAWPAVERAVREMLGIL